MLVCKVNDKLLFHIQENNLKSLKKFFLNGTKEDSFVSIDHKCCVMLQTLMRGKIIRANGTRDFSDRSHMDVINKLG